MQLDTRSSIMSDYHDHQFTELTVPHELSLEEKDQLLFALLEHLNLRVMRATFEPSLTILTHRK